MDTFDAAFAGRIIAVVVSFTVVEDSELAFVIGEGLLLFERLIKLQIFALLFIPFTPLLTSWPLAPHFYFGFQLE